MKKTKMSLTFLILLSAFLIAAALTSVLIIFDDNTMKKSLYNILSEINKALIITIIFGSATKLISDEIIKVKVNDKKMRRLGIYSIGEGKLDKKQTKIMFGGSGYAYPTELKFCFISGNAFMDKFQPEIMEAIKHGCKLKLIIADPIKSKDYLTRAEMVCKQEGKDGSYIDQCIFTIKLVEKMKNEIQENNYPGSIEVRHYHDEYRYNYRIAKYFDPEKGEIIRTWINFQPLNKDAIDQSLTVLGKYDEDYVKEEISRVDKESQSIVLSLDTSFDSLWDIYS